MPYRSRTVVDREIHRLVHDHKIMPINESSTRKEPEQRRQQKSLRRIHVPVVGGEYACGGLVLETDYQRLIDEYVSDWEEEKRSKVRKRHQKRIASKTKTEKLSKKRKRDKSGTDRAGVENEMKFVINDDDGGNGDDDEVRLVKDVFHRFQRLLQTHKAPVISAMNLARGLFPEKYSHSHSYVNKPCKKGRHGGGVEMATKTETKYVSPWDRSYLQLCKAKSEKMKEEDRDDTAARWEEIEGKGIPTERDIRVSLSMKDSPEKIAEEVCAVLLATVFTYLLHHSLKP